MKSRADRTTVVRRTVLSALFCAIAYLSVFLFRFSGIGGFLTFECKDAVLTICGLLVSPLAAAASTVFVALLEMLTISTTGVYGFLMNLIASLAFVLPASLLYRYRRKLSSAVIGLSLSVIAMTVLMLGFNMIVTPLYMHVTREAVAAMILPLLLPFNLTKAVLNAAIVLMIYKPLSAALQKTGFLPEKAAFRFSKRSVITLLVSLLLIAACSAVLMAVLGGSFELFRK